MNLSGPFKVPRSKRGAVRQYNAIMRAARCALSGGLSFGLDWPTFRTTFPKAYEHIRDMSEAAPKLPK